MKIGDVRSNKPVGFFDTGVGGISVLKKAIEFLPNENFIYFGDSKNAPYGTRPIKEVKELTFKAVRFLLEKGSKGIVIACNTATSVAVEDLRRQYRDIPIIGIEPALKPAVELNREGKIVIMATPITLSEKKFNNLVGNYGKNSKIVKLPCPGLVEIIESGVTEGEKLDIFLKDKLGALIEDKIAAVVLGCTHYPFAKKAISKIIGEDVPIIDGSEGTSRELKRRLSMRGLLNTNNSIGTVEIYNSSEDKKLIDFSYELLSKKE